MMESLTCNYCTEPFLNFKALLEHYACFHKEKLARFMIRRKVKDGQGIVEVTSQEEACRFFGWDIKDCNIVLIQ